MTTTSASGSIGNERLDRAILEFLEGEGNGAGKSREALLREYPDLATELNAFFANHDRLQALAQPTLAPSEHSPQPVAAIGATIRYFGDYELLAEIARGGMGVVYRARQKRLNRVVAIKMILAGELASPDDVRRFHAEAEAAANLEHPAIVPIYEIGEQGGQHYFSMGFVDGPSLASRLTDGPLAPREAAELLRQVAEAVHYAHGRGVIHRDLKPANILLDRQGQPRITDFGLAKRVKGDSGMTATGQILGTPSYMPPEQAAGRTENVRETADVYSLGAVLYAMLTGRPPFQADNPLDTLLQVLEREPVPPRQQNPKVPAELEVICLKCLEKDRRRRYQSADELAEDIGRFLRGEPIRARPAGPFERAIKWVRRKPAIAALAALSLAGAVAILVTLGISNWLIRGEQRKTTAALDARTAALTERTAALDREKRTAYHRTLALAQAELQINSVGRAEELLELSSPELRDWGWRYLKRAGQGNERVLGEHDKISCVSFHPDGTRLASAGWDAKVRIWDVATGKVLATQSSGHEGGFDRMLYSPDGRWIVASNVDRQIYVWDGDGRQLVQKLSGHTNRIWGLSFSKDSRWLASGSDDHTAIVWDLYTGSPIQRITGHSDQVKGVAFHPDGDKLATCSYDRTVKVWPLATVPTQQPPEPLATYPLSQRGSVVRYHPQGSYLAAGDGEENITVWDTTTGKVQCSFVEDYLNEFNYSPDGTRLVTSSFGKSIRFWDSLTGEETFSIRNVSGPAGIAFNKSGDLLATPCGNTIRLWNAAPLVEDQQQLRLVGHTRMVKTVAFDPQGKWLVSASEDYTLRVWDLVEGSPTRGQTLRTLKGHTAGVYPVAVSPDRKWIVSGGEDQTLRVWDAATGDPIRVVEHLPGLVTAIDFPQRGTRFVVAEGDAVPRLWDMQTWQPLHRFEHRIGFSHGAAISPDGRRVAVGFFNGTFPIYEADTGKEMTTLVGTHEHANEFGFGPAYSPNGKYLAASSGSHGAVTIWNTEDNTIAQTLLAETANETMAYSRVAFSPDSRLLAAAAFRGVADVWDVETGKRLLTLRSPGTVWSVTFSPDGRWLALAGGHRASGELRLWDLKAFADKLPAGK